MVGYQFAVPRYLFGCGSRQPGLMIRSNSLLDTKRGAKSVAQFHALRLRKLPCQSERATTKPHEDEYIKSPKSQKETWGKDIVHLQGRSRCFVFDWQFWNFPDFNASKPKRYRKRLCLICLSHLLPLAADTRGGSTSTWEFVAGHAWMIHTRSCRVQIYNILLSNGWFLMKNHFDWSLLLKIILQCRLDLTEVTDGMGMTDILMWGC